MLVDKIGDVFSYRDRKETVASLPPDLQRLPYRRPPPHRRTPIPAPSTRSRPGAMAAPGVPQGSRCLAAPGVAAPAPAEGGGSLAALGVATLAPVAPSQPNATSASVSVPGVAILPAPIEGTSAYLGPAWLQARGSCSSLPARGGGEQPASLLGRASASGGPARRWWRRLSFL